MIRRLINRFTSTYDSVGQMVEKKIVKSGWLAHSGIQRSGTNFLLVCLKRYKIRVINRHDPERNEPGHKHFRWYQNKSLIPSEISHQHGNCIRVDNIDDLNKACNYPLDTKHIVIFKERSSSLVSILNWGLRTNWFGSKDEAISAAERFLIDIDEYYKFWIDLSEAHPEFVVLISYESVVKDSAVLNDSLHRLGFEVIQADLSVSEVPQSPKNRKAIITYDDIAYLF